MRFANWIPSRRRLRAAVFLGVAGSLLASPFAWAHVTISPDTGTTDGYVREAFAVPNERDDATTTQVQVFFPTDHPLASVSVEPVPGWTATVQKITLKTPIRSDDGEVTEAVSSITWTGGHIDADQFQEFPVSLGPLPSAGTQLVFKALQTYSDGQVVRWIDVTQPGQPEPDHPAPTLSVEAAPAAAAAPAPTTASSGDPVATVLGGAGLVAGLAALGWTALRRRPTTPPAAQDSPKREKAGV